MKLVIIFLLAITLSLTSLAQEPFKAKTESGKEVILNPDGTWKYVIAERESPAGIHNKSASAKKSFQPSRGSFRIWYDETKWRERKTSDPEEKMRFGYLAGDAYVLVVAEEIEIPLSNLKKVALENALAAAPDAKVVSEEYRMVNGKRILCLTIEGRVEGISFTYYGYYYGGKEGTIQLVGFTGQNLFAKYQPELTKFLDGLEIY